MTPFARLIASLKGLAIILEHQLKENSPITFLTTDIPT